MHRDCAGKFTDVSNSLAGPIIGGVSDRRLMCLCLGLDFH